MGRKEKEQEQEKEKKLPLRVAYALMALNTFHQFQTSCKGPLRKQLNCRPHGTLLDKE